MRYGRSETARRSMRRFAWRVAGGAWIALWGAGAATAGEDIAAIPFESVPEGTTVVGGPNPIVLDSNVQVTGTVSHKGVYQLGSNAPTTYDVTVERYVVEAAAPANVGVVVALDHAVMSALCEDKDGCEVTMAMVNWDGLSNATSQFSHLFLSEANGRWRFSDNVGSIAGLDDDDLTQEIALFDFYFTDAETSQGVSNQRADSNPGFGLLNCAGCAYSDSTTLCRVVISD